MITVLHVISGLRQGGAEKSLADLAIRSDHRRFHHVVATLRDGGISEARLCEAGVEVAPLHFNRARDFLPARARLRRLINRTNPNVVQSWLYHADLLATLSAPRSIKLAWNLRNSDLTGSNRRSWPLLVSALAALSRQPDLIISNSSAGLTAHIARGYRPRHSLIIPNGVDLNLFRPMPELRADVRARFGLPTDGFVIGMPARYEGFKDHAAFIEAARLASADDHAPAFVLAGEGVDSYNTHLKSLIGAAGLSGRVFVVGSQQNMPALYAALDVVTLSSSHGEGFPNVLAEAMASGVPVVATDVGDVRTLVGDVGRIVPPRIPRALAEAWRQMAALEAAGRKEIGMRGRTRVETHFSQERMISAYQAAYLELLRVEG